MSNIGVIGAGGWGLGLAILLNGNGHRVTVWSKIKSELDGIRRDGENKRSLPGVPVPKEIELSEDLGQVASEADLLVLATASPYIRETAASLGSLGIKGLNIVNVSKGIEADTLMTMTQVIKDELKDARVAVLSGPSHAEEVSRGIPTTCVIGADTREYAEYLQNIFMSDVFRVYISPDVTGIELGGSLKNVIALAAGVADGLGYGDNTKAALITRGIHEITRLGVAMGGKMQTFYGLSGIGDLIVTCASMHSRNRRAGILIGQGKSMKEAMDEVNTVVEGVYSAKAALALAKRYNVELPLVESVNRVLFENCSAKDEVMELMQRDKKIENPDLPWE
ncbi:MAG: NAD(P)-dependent glycerol-3-phosphate dehydrogenase [Butyrivibrio sp.]|nr:NAD(P)-dependent glycerol-3-phosphate dehydrogenase [Butyrivibrio sp.]